ncbi:hypothetical protein WN55_07985 [Dufourea novaeangliae]|nr:hypothetical protein WN55_07985 [Dufourea novaeangliae]
MLEARVVDTVAQSHRACWQFYREERLAAGSRETNEGEERMVVSTQDGSKTGKRKERGVIRRRETVCVYSYVCLWRDATEVPVHRCTLREGNMIYRAIFRPRTEIRHYKREGRS